jgi:hypothetical protein
MKFYSVALCGENFLPQYTHLRAARSLSGGTLIIVQQRRADRFFHAAQQGRLTELMRRRSAGMLLTDEGPSWKV